MSVFLAYIGALCAAWAAMGGFCMRSDAIRRRQHWPKFTTEDKQRYAFGAGLLCALSLGLLCSVVQFSFALIFWAVLHGVMGVAIALWLPFANRTLARSFALAGTATLLSLCLFFIFGGVS